MTDTYAINCAVGKQAGGIPSLDAAISIAVDEARYRTSHGGTWGNEDDDDYDRIPLSKARRDVEVSSEENDDGEPYTLITVDGDEDLGILKEHRCPTCSRPGWRPRCAP